MTSECSSVLTVDELDELIRADAVGALADRPVVFVRIDRPAVELPAAAATLPCVLVAITAGTAVPAGFDIVLVEGADRGPWIGCADVEATVARLADAVLATPLAATILVQLLRVSSSLPIAAALLAESMAYSLLQSGPEFEHWLSTVRGPRAAVPDAEPPVLLERSAGTLDIRLNRPHVRNAVSLSLRDALVDALDLAHADSAVERVMLSGVGPSFCSGGDLSEFGTAPDPVTAHAVRTTRSPAASMAALAGRMHAVVHGACFGAGIELAAFCRRITADPDAVFALPEVAMGLVPGSGGTVSLARRIGRSRTAFLSITGDRVAADDALRWGLIDEIDEIDERLDLHPRSR